MNIPNPAQVASARTARLVREANTPAYTSESKPAPSRPHQMMIEVEDQGGRYWSGPYLDNQVKGVCEDYVRYGSSISDIDHYGKCWCMA